MELPRRSISLFAHRTATEKATQLPAMLEHSLYLGERGEHVVTMAGMRLRLWDDRLHEKGVCAVCFDKDALWFFS